MWSMWVIAVMIALAGYYSLADQQEMATTVAEKSAESLANNMAIYRAGVIDYYTRNPTFGENTVNFSQLVAGPIKSLPDWYQPPMINSTKILWANRIKDGEIYIYANEIPKINIISEITKLSQNSINTGEKKAGFDVLFSPVRGQTDIPLPIFTSNPIPDGSPVWLATAN